MIDKQRAVTFFETVDRKFGHPADVFLVGETTQLIEGWQRWNTQLDFFALVDPGKKSLFESIVNDVASEFNIDAALEYPGDVIPLPEGHESRSKPVSDDSWTIGMGISIRHFDPYSVCYRFIARGGQTDYDLIMRFLERSWVVEDEMDERLDLLLPELSFETIQQDPAELRRRYSGLKQMWHARQSILK